MRITKIIGWAAFLFAVLLLILLIRNGMDFQAAVGQIIFWK